jgi:nitrite reductase (NO-forming)
MKRLLLIGFIALLPVLAACTSATANKPSDGAAAGSAATQQLTVKAMDTMKFDPPTLSAKAGQPIQVTLDNTGALVHDFSITEGVSQPVKSVAQPGQKTVTTFTIDKPGTYTYFCSQPGHEQAGMKGTLTIQ